MSSRDWALALYDAGYQVVVAPLRGKRPTIAWKRWQTERVPREQVEEWFAHGEHNLALISGAISGTVVVDGDSPEACVWIEAVCTPTPMVVRTSKGAHYYFRHPGGRVPNSVRVLDEPPVDLRGDGGLTIGPGSVHVSGHVYQLVDGADLVSTLDLPVFSRDWFPGLQDAPEETFTRPLLRFQDARQKDRYEQARRYITRVPGPGQGQRNSGAYVQACRLVRGFSLSDDEALDLLRAWNGTCQPPLPETELAPMVQHARRYGTGSFGSMLQEARAIEGLICYRWPE